MSPIIQNTELPLRLTKLPVIPVIPSPPFSSPLTSKVIVVCFASNSVVPIGLTNPNPLLILLNTVLSHYITAWKITGLAWASYNYSKIDKNARMPVFYPQNP